MMKSGRGTSGEGCEDAASHLSKLGARATDPAGGPGIGRGGTALLPKLPKVVVAMEQPDAVAWPLDVRSGRDVVHHVAVREARKRLIKRHDLPQDDAKREDVGPRVEPVGVLDNFRSLRKRGVRDARREGPPFSRRASFGAETARLQRSRSTVWLLLLPFLEGREGE